MYLWARVIAAGLLLAAVAPWPYDYYTLMHLMVCVVTARGAYLAYHRQRTASTDVWRVKQQGWMWAFGVTALVFNPFLPVHLNRGTWVVIDIGVALMLIWEVRIDARHRFRKQSRTSLTPSKGN
jgi:hypothetical protein